MLQCKRSLRAHHLSAMTIPEIMMKVAGVVEVVEEEVADSDLEVGDSKEGPVVTGGEMCYQVDSLVFLLSGLLVVSFLQTKIPCSFLYLVLS